MRIILCLALALLAGESCARNHAGDVFTLAIWKLIIPLDDDGDLSADEVTMPTLRYFEDPDFFHLSDTSDSIVFRAQRGDAISEGFDAPRSELFEMASGGLEAIRWGTNDGKIHNMTLCMAINAVPSDSQKVICARISDGEEDILTLQLEGGVLSLLRQGEEAVTLIENYELGNFFNLMLIVDHGRIRALLEAKQLMVWPIEREGLFFAAGCVLPASPKAQNSSQETGEVEIQKLFVTHKAG